MNAEDKTKAATPYWTHLFQEMVFEGTLAQLEGSAFKVYVVIKAHASLKDGVCAPGLTRISRLSGQSPRQVLRHIATLEKAGLLVREKKGRSNRYKIIEKFNIDGAVVEWLYIPLSVTGLTKTLEQATQGTKHPEIRARVNAATTHPATIELAQTFTDPASPHAAGNSKMAQIFMKHRDRINAKKSDTHDT